MKRKRKLQAVAGAPIVQPEAETSTNVGKKSRKAAKKEAAAGAELAPVQEKAVPVSADAGKKAVKTKAEKKAEKKATQKARKALRKEEAKAGRNYSSEDWTARKARKKKEAEALSSNLAVFVGGFTFDATESKLRQKFEECGEITKVVFAKDPEGNRKGFAVITFKTTAGVVAACKFDRTDYGGRLLMVNKVNKEGKMVEYDLLAVNNKGDKGEGEGHKGKGDFEHEVSVRGLPWSTTSQALKKEFGKCGEVVNLKLLYNQDGNVRGSAFIAFKDAAGVGKALARNETDYGGRTIYVSKPGDFGSKGNNGKGKGKGNGKQSS